MRNNIRGVVNNFLATFLSRNSDVGGYWLPGLIRSRGPMGLRLNARSAAGASRRQIGTPTHPVARPDGPAVKRTVSGRRVEAAGWDANSPGRAARWACG